MEDMDMAMEDMDMVMVMEDMAMVMVMEDMDTAMATLIGTMVTGTTGMGKVMAETKGRGNPQVLNRLLDAALPTGP